ncbi:MAG: hypothetical protein FJW79_05695 [Actinobacteria bacterium]|nr:hypothetical protein [Actinomycetota bacterium]
MSIVIWEGTAEEAAALPAEVRRLLRSLGGTGNGGKIGKKPDKSAEGALDPAVQAFIAERARSQAARALVNRFVGTILTWEGTHAAVAKAKQGRGECLRLMRTGTPFGGFVYVWPGTTRVDFRLDAAHLEGRTHAYRRNVQSDARYQVTLRLKSKAALAEALELAQKAMEGVEQAAKAS